MKENQKRVEYLDFLRVIAISFVIAIHVNTLVRENYIATNSLYYFLITAVDSITRAGVPFFFMLTGYFLLNSKKKENYFSFIKRKVGKLVIVFVFFSFIYYIRKVLDDHLTFSIFEFIEKFSNNELCYHLWYMYTIIIIYMFIPYEKKLIQKLNKKEIERLMAITILFGNFLLTINMILKNYDHVIFNSFTLPNLIVFNNYVILGYYLSKYEIKNKKLIYIIGIISLILMPIAHFFTLKDFLRDDGLLTGISIFPIFYAIALFQFIKENYNKLKINEKIKRIIRHCSKLSFYIYLVHILVLDFFSQKINKYWIHDRLYENILYIIILFIITFIGSYILSIIFDFFYNKIENKLKNIKKKTHK